MITNINPLEQFQIYNFLNLTNLSFIMILGFIIYYFLIWLSNLWTTKFNLLFSTLISTLIGIYPSSNSSNSSSNSSATLWGNNMFLFPFVFSIFSIIFTSNLLGMIPYSFTPTSHISVTLGLSLNIILGITILGHSQTHFNFYSLFLPYGTPIYLIPLLVGIEFISYLARAFSLSLRLTANVSAGHCLFGVISLLSYSANLFILPLLLLITLFSLEILVALLQAYVFTLLTCSYLNDIFNLDS